MRVLVCRPGPWFSVKDVNDGWCNALRRLGCHVIEFNLDDRLNFYDRVHLEHEGHWQKALTTEQAVALAAKGIEAACYEYWPDLVLVISGFYLPEAAYELMRKRGHKVVLLHTESPYEDDRQLVRAEWVDLNILNDPTNIDRFPNAHYFGHAYDPVVHHPRPVDPTRESDFCFVGTGYPSRLRFFEQVNWDGIDAVFAGNMQWVEDDSPLKSFLIHDKEHCLDNAKAAEFYCSTKASANLYRREAETPELSEGWSMGPREVELAACGTFYMTEERGENREVLPMVPTFSEAGEFSEKLRYYLARPSQRAQVAREARAAIQGRTFEASARRLLSLIR